MNSAAPTLLYIDDDAALARLVERGLSRHGFKVVHAATGAQGLDIVARGGIDVIALDQYMPGLDGLETLERIMAIANAPPVVFVTASQDSSIAVTALKAGAADYLVKDVRGDFVPLLQVAADGALRQAALKKARDEAEAEVHASRDRYAALAAEREVLLREVNHRVGNSLQIIASLLHLQASSAAQDDVKAALTNAMGRVAAVAQVHRRLYTSHDLKNVMLNQYLEALLEDLRRSAEGNKMSRLTLQAEAIEIDPDRAVAIGIIVNELVMNAVKYAYPDRAGPIHVGLSGNGDDVVLSIADDGSASTSRSIRARPAWANASSRQWPASSRPRSSATPTTPARGSCCDSAALGCRSRRPPAPPPAERSQTGNWTVLFQFSPMAPGNAGL
jgi:two-component sensor histidine kinase